MATGENINGLVKEYRALGIDSQIDFEKFHTYAIIAHSTAIEGSTLTVEENRILLDDGITIKGKSAVEQMMNLDLRDAYAVGRKAAEERRPVTVEYLKELSATTMRRTGSKYKTITGTFDASKGDLRLTNVTAGYGGRSYISFTKVPGRLQEFCDWLNQQREQMHAMTPEEIYVLSFRAHLHLVTIHPWADGNGRTARLLMNQIQFEGDIIPTVVLKEDRADYIAALKKSQESDDETAFILFMKELQTRNLKDDIRNFKKSMKNDLRNLMPTKKKRTPGL